MKEFTWSLGAEYWYQDSFALRMGYFNESLDKGARKFLTLGAGFKYNVVKIDISYFNALSAITSVYLIASVVPMLSMFDFVLKGTVAIWIFSFYNVQPIIILSITSIMWLLNFVLPAIIGSYFVLTFKPNFVK